MNPARLEFPDFVASKPRSRGDEPGQFLGGGFLFGKTPLTRRWTVSASPAACSHLQTSAHAEMDLYKSIWILSWSSNLRSRGDGPQGAQGAKVLSDKPPLTRG